LKEKDLLVARRVLSTVLVSMYIGLLCGLAGGLLTFWMFGFGALLTLPAGLALGAALGWKTPLRDAITLFSSCFGSLLALRCLQLMSALPREIDLWLMFLAVPVSGFVSWLAYTRLSPYDASPPGPVSARRVCPMYPDVELHQNLTAAQVRCV
jgi:hypothetical protein